MDCTYIVIPILKSSRRSKLHCRTEKIYAFIILIKNTYVKLKTINTKNFKYVN